MFNKYIAVIIFIFSGLVFGQSQVDQLKNNAVKNMQVNKLGEAIDLLNKYIAAKPQVAEGYNLRGICYERRGQYEMALYDFRSARKLAPNNQEINKNLQRASENFNKLLFNKIEGHKREIAINPKKPVNYLEIGKSYKNMGEWKTAEDWYDKYLAKEEASPDEIIRYTEILAKNNHIAKGWPILKRYCEKYPKDNRLWSRYGYFSLWLGKTQIAIKAFENALALKPYFKEAMDGLDQAKGKGYIYTFNDTTAYKHQMQGGPKTKRQPVFEYAIDKYYKILKKNPQDTETRYKLIDELIKNNRFEEAYQQLQAFGNDSTSTDEKYQNYYAKVKSIRDSATAVNIIEYRELVVKDPTNEEAAVKLAEYFSTALEYDSAITVLSNYLKDKPEDKFTSTRYRMAQYQAWNYQYEDAISQLNILLKNSPNNQEYQLLRSQIASWTDQDLDLADNYLTGILSKEPDNFIALVTMASVKIKKDDFETAKTYLDKAKSISPNAKEIESVQNYYDSRYANAEWLKIYKILEEARQLTVDKDCESAVQKYDEYFSKITAPTRLELIEYADVVACAKNPQKSIEIYDKLLAEEYDHDIAVYRATKMLMAGDSINALAELKKLSAEKPDDYDANFNLGIAYAKNKEYSNARDVWEKLLKTETDTIKIGYINQQIGWLPTGSGGWGSFPNHFAIAPVTAFYRDNQNFSFNNAGLRLEAGITNFLSIGGTFIRTNLKDSTSQLHISSLKGNVFLRINDMISANAGFGRINSSGIVKRNVTDATIKVEKPETFSITGYFENTDARLILYSPNLLNVSYDVNLYRLLGYYKSKGGLYISGYMSSISVSDNNDGNDFQLRIGKNFYPDILIGYEYYYDSYTFQSAKYYSPKDFESHSLWADWHAQQDEETDITVGGKLGYIPSGDLLTRELYIQAKYEPLKSLIFSGKITIGSTYRNEISYNYVSAFINAYWSLN
jgi:Flp pilus assembly protein TadD